MTPPDDPRTGAFFDFSDRAKLRVTGADRLRFLNGQLTNDVRKAGVARTIEACALNAKGRITAHLFVSGTTDAFYLDADREQRETLLARLERYLIADDVRIEDVSEEFAIFHCGGANPPCLAQVVRSVESDRFAFAGWDIWLEAARSNSAREDLAARFAPCDMSRADTLRIERGIPRWGAELNDEIIPQEANLEARCIDYMKGCYIGQEVISRMKMSGQTNKRLCGLSSADGGALSRGMQLQAAPDEPKSVGWITSATFSERCNRHIALGYVKRGHNLIGTTLFGQRTDGNSSLSRVEVVDLPFI